MLEYATSPEIERRAVGWAHLEDDPAPRVDEEEDGNDALPAPGPGGREKTAAAFVSGHGQFLPKTVFSSLSAPSHSISVSDFIGSTGNVLLSPPPACAGGASMAGSEALSSLATSPTSVGDILDVWGIGRGGRVVPKCPSRDPEGGKAEMPRGMERGWRFLGDVREVRGGEGRGGEAPLFCFLYSLSNEHTVLIIRQLEQL